jgi:phage gp16-like protein
MKTFARAASPALRKMQLAAIHIGKAQIGMAEDTYRSLLKTQFNVASAADLDDAGRARLLDHFAKLGFVSNARAKKAATGPMRTAPSREPLLSKIDALLFARGRDRSYIEPGMVKRICKVDSLAFCSPEASRKLVAALEYDARR